MKTRKPIIKKELTAVQEFKLRRGEWLGTFPMGYDTIHVSRTKYNRAAEVFINEENKIIVQDIFESYATGKTGMNALAEYINSKYPIKIPRSSIGRILNNTFYIGTMKFNGHEFPHCYPVFINKKTFEKCQNILRFNNKYSLYADIHSSVAVQEVKETPKIDNSPKDRILDLCKDAINQDSIVEIMGIPGEKIRSIIFDLEMDGLIEEIGPSVWKIKSE